MGSKSEKETKIYDWFMRRVSVMWSWPKLSITSATVTCAQPNRNCADEEKRKEIRQRHDFFLCTIGNFLYDGHRGHRIKIIYIYELLVCVRGAYHILVRIHNYILRVRIELKFNWNPHFIFIFIRFWPFPQFRSSEIDTCSEWNTKIIAWNNVIIFVGKTNDAHSCYMLYAMIKMRQEVRFENALIIVYLPRMK